MATPVQSFKWITFGSSDNERELMFFILPASADTARLMADDVYCADTVVAQAQTEEWAVAITAALNAQAEGR